MIVALWGRDQLAEDSGVEDAGGWGGVTLAHNVGSPPRWMPSSRRPRRQAPMIPRHGAETFWGGYSAVFVDPEAIRGRCPQPALDAREPTAPSPSPSNRLLQGGNRHGSSTVS